MMDLDVLDRVWPILAFLGYLLAVCTLSVLAGYRRAAIGVHDRAREAKLLRMQFESRDERKDDEQVQTPDVKLAA